MKMKHKITLGKNEEVTIKKGKIEGCIDVYYKKTLVRDFDETELKKAIKFGLKLVKIKGDVRPITYYPPFSAYSSKKRWVEDLWLWIVWNVEWWFK